MPRPRRPVPATVFAILLLSMLALWAWGHVRRDSLLWGAEGGGGWGAGNGPGEVWVRRHYRRWFEPGWRKLTDEIGDVEQRDFHPAWFAYKHDREGWTAQAPMWFVALVPALGLWWSWRARTAGAGFPMEPAAREAK